ncbi:MAG: class I SAM-dependent methyltransferase [Candidatus Hodarchaeales archaeon]|jgi:predicted O-methyltransferase YrrM
MIGYSVFRFLEKISGHRLTDHLDYLQVYFKLISLKAGFKFKKKLAECKNLKEYYDLVNSFEDTIFRKSKFVINIKLYQKKAEIIDFIKLYSKSSPKIILEIGTYDGGTLFFLSRFARPDAILITVDLPLVRDGAGYSPAKIPFYKSFTSYNQKIHFIRENSQSPKTVKKIEKILKNRKIDVLFIDGDHSYEGVKKDFEIFSKYVKKGGIIAFHDIVEHPAELKCEVDRFWNEIKKEYEFKEFISDKGENWAGIGILFYSK